MSARITRTIDTDLDAEDLWPLVADGDRWAEWLVDDADLDVTPGAEGTVVDDGEQRDIRIDRVEPDRSVSFTWWPHTRAEQVSTVELVVLPAPTGSRLHVTETYLRASAAPDALAWDLRALLLQIRALSRISLGAAPPDPIAASLAGARGAGHASLALSLLV